MTDEQDKGRGNPTMPGYHSPKVRNQEAPLPSDPTDDVGPPVEPSGELRMDVFAKGQFDDNRQVEPEKPPPTKENPTAARSPLSAKNYVKTPLVEIEVVHEHGPAPRTERPWKTLEIWTRNRVYTMDPTMTCIEVMDRVSNKAVPEHGFIGSRLVGGQHREGDRIELSCPFPRPGTEAVFEHPHGRRGNFSRTSTVTRVVLRLHVVTVAPSYVVPTWETITGSVRVTPPSNPPPNE